MEVFKFLHQGKLKPTWTYEADGAIWRIAPTPSGKLVGEERDLNTKTVSFFCLNEVTGEVLWNNVRFDEPWWISIEAVHRDVMYLHGFATPDLPEHKAITAIDLLTGTRMWSNEELSFIDAVENSLFASRESIEGPHLLELDCRTGAILKSWGSNNEVVREARQRKPYELEEPVEFPVSYQSSIAGDSPDEMCVQEYCAGRSLAGPIGIVDYDDHVVIFNRHEQATTRRDGPPQLKNILTVLEKKSGSVLFEETLNAVVTSVAPESFFVHRQMLFYIKDRSTLTALRISQPMMES
jgi:hypothetical protein